MRDFFLKVRPFDGWQSAAYIQACSNGKSVGLRYDALIPLGPRRSMTTTPSLSSTAAKFLLVSATVGVLYLGRDVLSLLALAGTLAFALAPVVRTFRRLGLSQAPAAISTLVLVGTLATLLGLALAAQFGALSRELPDYKANLVSKLEPVSKRLLHPLSAQKLIRPAPDLPASEPLAEQAQPLVAPTAPGVAGPVAGYETLQRIVAWVWGPIGAVGVVALVMMFTLLEQDALRDRLIRLLGGSDVRAATSAINDAGQRLTRYFASQVTVNALVALVVWGLLLLIGVPHAMVWAVLAGVLRFVPYIGFPSAALCTCVMAAAASPGWEMVSATALMFITVELVVANVIEPRLYGHATGLSPISVVVAAIFWSAVWGPIGLLLSTPLTLCLVVAGRHVPALGFLDVLLGEAPALTLAQRFYQRILSGDSVEIRADARRFIKRQSLAAYCDKVVIPAFDMAREDFKAHVVTPEQVRLARIAVLDFFALLSGGQRAPRSRGAVLDDDLGLRLREQRIGGRPVVFDVPAGSVQLCVSLDDQESHLVAELLVRVLRDAHYDARHATVAELAKPPEGAKPEAVGSLFIVCVSASPRPRQESQLLQDSLKRLPKAQRVALMSYGAILDEALQDQPHLTAYSFVEALALLRAMPSVETEL